LGIFLCVAALAGCGGETTVDTIEADLLAAVTEQPVTGVQGTVLDVDCPPYAQTDTPKEGTRLKCGLYNVDKGDHEPDEQIGKLEVTVGQEDDYTAEACTATASSRGPKC